MKSTDKFVLVLVASLALLLAGCGGGGSSTTAPPVDTGPTPAEIAITNAKTALQTAQTRVSSASTDAEMLSAYQAVQREASNLINVLAENGGSAADRNSAIQTLNGATAEIGKLETAIENATKENAAAIGKLLAGLDQHTAAATSPRPVVSPAMSVTAAHGKATTVDAADSTTVANSNTKLKGAMGTTVAGANGWSGTMVTATQDAIGTTTTKKTDTVLVYTNIEMPKRVDFDDAVAGFPTGTTFAATTNILTVITTGGDSNIQASGFSTGNAPVPYGDPDVTDEAHEVDGTYAGAPGEYRCTESGGNSCTSQGANNGIQLVGGWTFHPNAGAMATLNDSNYSYFGWWLREDADGDYSPTVFDGHRHNPSGATALAIPTNLTGKASYSGPAVGKFAIAGLPSTGGHFTADASLDVDFEGTSGGVGDIEGKVSAFMVDGTEMPWLVDFNADADGLEAGGAFSGTAVWTIDGTKSVTSTANTGQYRGTFRPNNTATPVDNNPMSATGTWEVPYVTNNRTEAIGHMIGAFGVTKDD